MGNVSGNTSSRPSQNLDLRQSQNLVMTPQLQQAINMLQLSNIELSQLVETELERNPLLEKEEKSDDIEEADYKASEAKDEVQEQFESVFDAGTERIGSGGSMKFDSGDYNFEDNLVGDKTLRTHLNEQLVLAFKDPRDVMIGSMLIDGLDESGYLRATPEELAKTLNCSEDRVDRLLQNMKLFDPAGVFASGLEECLALQLKDLGKFTEKMEIMLENLHFLAQHDFQSLAQECGVPMEELKSMLTELKSLNPKPAGLFENPIVQTAIPDVLMKRRPSTQGGGWRIELNHATLPKVLLNQTYVKDIKKSAKTKQDKEYVNEKIQSANFLIRAMDQRAHTILKTAAAIVEHQSAFFDYGIEFLKPLTLKEIADEIDMHESTISRVTTGKYIATPRGLLELKFFFSTALQNEQGVAHSAESIKARIKSLTDNEDPKKILSDDKLVQILKEEGIDVARRTVAKYRDVLRIGSSVERRRQKRNPKF